MRRISRPSINDTSYIQQGAIVCIKATKAAAYVWQVKGDWVITTEGCFIKDEIQSPEVMLSLLSLLDTASN